MVSIHERLKQEHEEIISYLPLSHVAAQVVDIFVPILNAGTSYFAQPDALRVRRRVLPGKHFTWKYLNVLHEEK